MYVQTPDCTRHSTSPNPPPGPRGVPLLGVLPKLTRNPLWYFEHLHRTFGDLVRFEVAGNPVHIVTHPDHVKRILIDNADNYWKGPIFKRIGALFGNGLVLNDGDSWKKQRRLMAPSFEQRQLEDLLTLMQGVAGAQIATWQSACETGTPVEMQDQMMRITLGVVIKAMFGYSVTDQELQAIADAFNRALSHLEVRLLTFFLPDSFPLPGRRDFERARVLLDRSVARVVAERRAHPEGHNDLLALLLCARYEDGAAMDDAQLRDEIVTIFFGGYEATANALAWAQYAISQHPAIAARLHDEAASVLGSRPLDLQGLSRLGYTEMVLKEAMRLYTPFYVSFRTAHQDDRLGRYDIPGGSHMLLLHYLTHRHPHYWPSPETFDPERFTREASAARPRHAYYPFGAGQHMCIGKHFAMLEMKLVLAMIMRDYRLALAEGSVIEMNPRATLRSRYGIPLVLSRH